MLELQHALSALAIYPSGRHVQQCRYQAFDRVRRMLIHYPKIDIFVFDDRVIFEEKTLPSSFSLLKGIFGHLQKRGVDRIRFLQGIEEWEIQFFFDALLADTDHESARLRPSPHITFGFIKNINAAGNVNEPYLRKSRDFEFMTDVINQMLDDSGNDENLDLNMLSDVAFHINEVVASAKNSLIPLASLKKYDEYTSVHVINVAILVSAFSETLGSNSNITYDLCLAAVSYTHLTLPTKRIV